MLLSELVGKSIYSGSSFRGVCRGICFSLKNRTVKYLLCAGNTSREACTEFAVSISNIAGIEDVIRLKRLRMATPKYYRFYPGRPAYSDDGFYLGLTSDLVIDNYIVSRVILDTDKSYPVSAIAALGDAVLLRKEPLFPLGFRLGVEVPAQPAPIKEGTVITRATLKTAIASGKLIYLTTRLLPTEATPEAVYTVK